MLSTVLPIMKLENTIIHLIGFAGVGKYTIAQLLAADTGAKLVDNHLLNNPVFTVIDLKNGGKLDEEVWEQTRKIRHVVMDTIRTISPKEYSFIFTNCLFDHDPEDHFVITEMQELAKARNGHYIPVRLHCSTDENMRRKSNEQRCERMKPTNIDNVARHHAEYEVVKIYHENVLDLDVTELSAQQAAEHIMQHCAKIVLV